MKQNIFLFLAIVLAIVTTGYTYQTGDNKLTDAEKKEGSKL